MPSKTNNRYLAITQFAGINTNQDARRILPNKDTGGIAEATIMDNVDINREGAMITSYGFDKVSEGPGTGGVLNLLNYEKDETNRYLIITHDDDHYSITPTNTTWSTSNLGDYGDVATTVGGTVYVGSAGDRLAILGNEITANVTQKADLSAAMTDVTGGPPDGPIMATFMGRLFVASGKTLYYTNVDDEDDWSGGGTIGFNDIIRGLVVDGQRLHVITRTYNQGVFFGFDDNFAISTPQKEPYENPFGCLAPKTVQRTGNNAYYWSDRGVLMLGAEQGYDNQGIPRVNSLSKDIEPSLAFANKGARDKANSVYWGEEQQYWMALPYDRSQVPSLTFVRNENWDAWTTRSGFYPGDFELFRNSDYEHELYFGDANSPTLYKFNKERYSYDGFGYTRKWRSKVFTMGDGKRFKGFNRLDLAGSMDAGTTFDVTIQVDNTTKKYRIDNTFLIKDSFSNYIGDDWIGDAYLGGDAPSESRFKRFYAPLDFPRELREGLELQITIENNGEEQPWKIDFLGIDYEFRPVKQTPGRRYVNTQVQT